MTTPLADSFPPGRPWPGPPGPGEPPAHPGHPGEPGHPGAPGWPAPHREPPGYPVVPPSRVWTDQGDWPGWFRVVLKRWLDLFHVHYRPELLEHLRELDAKGVGRLTLHSVARRYAYLATFQKL